MSMSDKHLWKDESWLRQKYCVEGLTIQEIADFADTSFDTIRYYKDKFEIKGRPNGIPPRAVALTKQELKELYWGEEMSLNTIANEIGVSGSWVLRKMDEFGIETRVQDQQKGTAWKDAETLERMYWDEGMSLKEIGDELGCSMSTVGDWMERLGVDRIDTPDEMPPNHRITHYGYEVVRTKINQTEHRVGVHQLVAVANGADVDKVFSGGKYHVHHKNGIPWDNRPENLELLTKSEHHAHHYAELEKTDDGEIIGYSKNSDSE